MNEQFRRSAWNHFSGTQLSFGPRALGTLGALVHRRGAKRVFIVADEVLQSVGIVDFVKQVMELTSAEVQLFTDGEMEPTTDTVEKAAAHAAEFEPDMFVGVGGGSNMDLAKTCCAASAHGCDPATMLGFDSVPGPLPTLVCLPTTAGTGSEVSHIAFVKNSATGKKESVLSQHIRPDVAIVDPYLTVSCPAKVTAESGIGALTRAIEAYLVSNFYSFVDELEHGLPYEGNHPLGDMYAEKSISLIGQHLERAVDQPEHLAARSGMSLAATLGGAASSDCGVGLAHALEYSIGSHCGCAHGVGNGIVLPEVMRFLLPTRTKRIAQISQLLGVAEVGDNDESNAERAIQRVAAIRSTIGLPSTLGAVGVEEQNLPQIATESVAIQRLIDLTPGSPTQADALKVLQACH